MDQPQQFQKTLESKLSDSHQSKQTLDSKLRESQQSQQTLESELRESQRNHRKVTEMFRSEIHNKKQVIQLQKSELERNHQLIAELSDSPEEKTDSWFNRFDDMNIEQSVSEGACAVSSAKLPQPVNVKSQKLPNVVISVKKSETVMKSFRKCCDLSFIHISKFTKVNEFKVDSSVRLCCHDNKLYLADPGENTISVYTTEKELTDTLILRDIRSYTGPVSLHPVSRGHFMLAAKSGLYLIDGRGRLVSKVLEGSYQDVHCDGDICAVIEDVLPRGKIHILSNVAPYSEQSQFELSHNGALAVHVTNTCVYVSDCITHQVTKYSTQGQRLAMYEWYERDNPRLGGLCDRRVCMSDDSGRVLVTDWDHDRLQVVSLGTGEWRVVSGVEVQDPFDALVIDEKLFVLSGCLITMYKFCN